MLKSLFLLQLVLSKDIYIPCKIFYNWGIDRINQRDLPTDCFSNDIFLKNPSDFVVYVLDTGIDINHKVFKGENIEPGVDCLGDTCVEGDGKDIYGHGTKVTSMIVGKFGVTRKIKIVSVKVLNKDGKGTFRLLNNGLKWVIEDYQKRKEKNEKLKGIVNMSLNSLKNELTFDFYLKRIEELGLISVSAAGNEKSNACDFMPANSKYTITVGSTDFNDKKSIFSNYGECVDIFAPGNLLYTPITSTKVLGTSYSAPIVSGIIVELWSKNLHMTNIEIKKLLYSTSTKNKIKNLDENTINRLVYLEPKIKNNKKFFIILYRKIVTKLNIGLSIEVFYSLLVIIILLILSVIFICNRKKGSEEEGEEGEYGV